MNHTKFPEGWDERKIRRVLSIYEEQSEEDAMAEDKAGVQSSETVMAIPHELVPEVRESLCPLCSVVNRNSPPIYRPADAIAERFITTPDSLL